MTGNYDHYLFILLFPLQINFKPLANAFFFSHEIFFFFGQ